MCFMIELEKVRDSHSFNPYNVRSVVLFSDNVLSRIQIYKSVVTTRPIPYLHLTSSILRKSPLEQLSVT